MWNGNFNPQRSQLGQCFVASQQSHGNTDPRSMMSYYETEIPECMENAGYEKALSNESCSQDLWVGDSHCYSPKSAIKRLLYKMLPQY